MIEQFACDSSADLDRTLGRLRLRRIDPLPGEGLIDSYPRPFRIGEGDCPPPDTGSLAAANSSVDMASAAVAVTGKALLLGRCRRRGASLQVLVGASAKDLPSP